jgi:hypothetical protein
MQAVVMTRQPPKILLTKRQGNEKIKEVRRKLTRALTVSDIDWSVVDGLFIDYVYAITKHVDADVLALCGKFYHGVYMPAVRYHGWEVATRTVGPQVYSTVQSCMNAQLAEWLNEESKRPLWTTSAISSWCNTMVAFVTDWWMASSVGIVRGHVADINAHPPKRVKQ